MNVRCNKWYLLPFLLTICVITVDQLSKMLIVAYIPAWSIGYEFFGDFLRIVCVYNTGAAFSLGHSLSNVMRIVMLLLIPTGFICALAVMYFRTSFSAVQRWFLCGIIGGGTSNLIDRFLRSDGVVDFIDVKFYGLFGLERWPTFNIADAFIVVCACGLFVVMIVHEQNAKKTGANSPESTGTSAAAQTASCEECSR
ncbi:MAG: signal peptidase II [Treponema sp.]